MKTEFKAKSGNTASVRIGPPQNGAQFVSIGWREQPSTEDIKEFNREFELHVGVIDYTIIADGKVDVARHINN